MAPRRQRQSLGRTPVPTLASFLHFRIFCPASPTSPVPLGAADKGHYEKKNLLARDIESEKKKQCKLRAWKVLEIRYLASSLYLLKHAVVLRVYIYVHTREDAFSIYLARP